MRFLSVSITSLALLASAIAAPTVSRRHVVHERRERTPHNWNLDAETLSPDTKLPLRIALTQGNMDKADEFLMDVSDPASPNFGKHWSPKKVAETFAPSEETVTSVLDWLAEHGIAAKQSQSLNWVHADVTVAEAEALLQTKYSIYKHGSTGQSHVACDDYSVPEDIRGHIDFVTPTLHFDARVITPKQKRSLEERTATGQPGVGKSIGKPGSGSLPKQGDWIPFGSLITELENCDVAITPDCLRALYEFPPWFPANPENSYGIVEYTPQAYLPGDLDLFFANFSKSQVGQRPILDSIDGGFLQYQVEGFEQNGEADLDLEYGMTLVYPQQVTLYQTGDDVEGASFNNFLDALDASYCKGDDPTQDGVYPDPYCTAGTYGCYTGPETCGGFAATKVVSTSYAYNEHDLTPAYEMRQCNEYLKLGLQGTTFVFSSGDYGVAGNQGLCINPDGSYTPPNANYGAFNPTFPSTCPYVTSVGATQIKPNGTIFDREEAAETVIYSGGGFSNVFGTPSYQKSAVKSYFKNHLPPYGPDRYNTTQRSRGTPDVSANGVNYVIAVDGSFSFVYGTSAAAPVFGSILTLINSARLSFGKGTLGFLNPSLYANPGIMNDIVSGGNQGCGTPGFTAVQGWDPVTGLGTPNFPRMLAYYLFI